MYPFVSLQEGDALSKSRLEVFLLYKRISFYHLALSETTVNVLRLLFALFLTHRKADHFYSLNVNGIR